MAHNGPWPKFLLFCQHFISFFLNIKKKSYRYLWRNGPWPNHGARGPPGSEGKPGPPGTVFFFCAVFIQVFLIFQ